MRRTLAVLSFAACVGAGLWAQQGITPEGASTAEGKKGIPVTMTECEGKDNCATWTFLGAQGNGQWPSGEMANLTVERYDADSVVIRRADSTGASAGLTAVYTGTRTGDRVGGKVTSSWPGHWDSKTEYWYATVEKSPQGLPSVMRFCGPAHCGTLTWGAGRYDAVYDNERGRAPYSTYKVELFTPEAILINRTDEGVGTAVLTGRISPEGNSILDGRMTFTSLDGNSGTFPYRLTWGSALSAAGGSPTVEPRPQRTVVVEPVVCYPWFFTVVCD